MSRAGHLIFATLAIATGLLTFAFDAQAVDQDVKKACKGDYFRHCASHEVGSPELRQCMRNVGENLSTPCLVALVKAGEITKKDIDQHNASKSNGQAGTVAEPQKPKSKSNVAEKQNAKANAKAAQVQKPKAKGSSAQAALSAKMPAGKQAANSKGRVKVQTAAKERKNGTQIKQPKNTASANKYAKATEQPEFNPPRKAKSATYDAPIASEPEVAYTHNLCRAKRLNGSVVEFTCGLDQRCCYLQLSGQEYCRPLDKPCF